MSVAPKAVGSPVEKNDNKTMIERKMHVIVEITESQGAVARKAEDYQILSIYTKNIQ